MFSEPEMGMTAVYLASSAGDFTNGAVILVDGGHNLLNP
jgi:enoyl-[acyl-carrier-protein] reductase (NADH)